MTSKLLVGALLGGAIVASAPIASAQVEASTVTEESRPPTPEPAAPTLGPRSDPTVFGLGLASTFVGGVAVPVGALVAISGAMESLGCIGRGEPCTSSDTTGTVGAVLVGSGIILLAVGIPMIVIGGKRLPREAALDPFVVRF